MVTVAFWPTSTLPMSDSLSATSSFSFESWARTMKAVELLLDDALLWELPTVSPTALAIEATVPAAGARSEVASSASWACLTASSALWTAAEADSTLCVEPCDCDDEPLLPPEPERLLLDGVGVALARGVA